MDLKQIADKATDMAPAIAGVLAATGIGAPAAGALAALAALGRAFGLGSSATPEAIHAAITTDPDTALKLQLAEFDFQLKTRDQDLEEFRAQLADVQNARDMATQQTKVTGHRDINLYILAWVIVLCFFGLVGLMFYITVPKDNVGPLNQLFGAITAGFSLVLGYFYGTSKGEVEKSKQLAQSRQGP